MTEAQIRAALQREGLRWLRTPYHHGANVHGAGVDCLMLLVEVFKACGCIPLDFDPRPYSHQWHLHRSEEVYLQGMERFGRLLPEGAAADVGDIAIWRFGRTFSHAGLLVRPQDGGELEVLHARMSAGEVTLDRLDASELAARESRVFTFFGAEAC